MTRLTKTRLLLRDKCKVVHSDRLYRPTICLYTGVRTAKIPFRNGRNCNTNSQRHTQLSQKNLKFKLISTLDISTYKKDFCIVVI